MYKLATVLLIIGGLASLALAQSPGIVVETTYFDNPGAYTVNWNTETIPSGVYFAVLKTEKTRQIRPLTLIK
jgi:hypothetical protein